AGPLELLLQRRERVRRLPARRAVYRGPHSQGRERDRAGRSGCRNRFQARTARCPRWRHRTHRVAAEAWSSICEIRAETSPTSRAGLDGGSGAGHAALSLAKAARILSTASGSSERGPDATASSITRSARHTKPRLSWYSTGLTNAPFSMDSPYSDC